MEETEEETQLNDEVDLCVVCCSKVKSLTLTGDDLDELDKNLDVIFLLKNLMQVPDILIKNNLKECGNPQDWGISLCEPCRKLNGEARCLHLEILNLGRKLEAIQKLVLDKTRLSILPSSPHFPVSFNDDKDKQCQKEEIWRRARYFVANCKQA